MALCLVSLVLISIWIKLLAFHIFLNLWLLNFDNNVVIVFRILLICIIRHFFVIFPPKLVSAQLLLDSFSTKLRIQTELGLYLFLLHFVSWKYYNYGIYRTTLYSTIAISTIVYSNITRLSKDNGPASKEPNETHNECMLHFHKFHKVL